MTPNDQAKPALSHPADGRAILEHLCIRTPSLRLALGYDAPLRHSALDSIDLVELLIVAEAEFGVRLTQDEFDRALTVGDLAELIATRAVARKARP